MGGEVIHRVTIVLVMVILDLGYRKTLTLDITRLVVTINTIIQDMLKKYVQSVIFVNMAKCIVVLGVPMVIRLDCLLQNVLGNVQLVIFVDRPPWNILKTVRMSII